MARKKHRLRERSLAWHIQKCWWQVAWFIRKYWKPVVAGVVVGALIASTLALGKAKNNERVNTQEPIETLPASEFQAFTPLENVPLDAELQEFIFGVAEVYGLEGELVMAVIGQESNYKHCVIGDDGESMGLMQVMKRFHEDRMERLKVTNLLDPYENVIVGIDYLAECVDRFGIEYGLIAYNAGPDDAIAMKEAGIISEYAEGVMALYELYKGGEF